MSGSRFRGNDKITGLYNIDSGSGAGIYVKGKSA